MIQAAMIGLGRWGQTTIAAVQGNSNRVRFVHGVTKEPELVRDFAARHDFRLSTDLADVLADPAVQAVWLATPHSLHVEQVRAIAATGRPVWCEKPLALTRAEAEFRRAGFRRSGSRCGRRNGRRPLSSGFDVARADRADPARVWFRQDERAGAAFGQNPHDRRDDALVAGATAEVAAQFHPHARLVGLRQPQHDVARGDQHARCAVAALQTVLGREGLAKPHDH